MSLPVFINIDKVFDPQDSWRSEREIVNIAFGGEENVPTVKDVRMSFSLMRKQYSRRTFVGFQISYSPYRENDFIRRVMVDSNGMLDAEKIRDKYKEVLKYGKQDVEYVNDLRESRERQRNQRDEFRDEVKEVFSDSPIFNPYNDEIFPCEHSYNESFDTDIVSGRCIVTSDGVNVELKDLSVEESQQVIDLILKMRGK